MWCRSSACSCYRQATNSGQSPLGGRGCQQKPHPTMTRRRQRDEMICHVCVFIRISKARRDKGDTQAHLLSGAERCRICQRHHGLRYHLPQERRSSVAKEARVGIEAQQPYAVSGHSTCSTVDTSTLWSTQGISITVLPVTPHAGTSVCDIFGLGERSSTSSAASFPLMIFSVAP